MKKILLILIVLGGGYYYSQGNENKTLSVSELINNPSIDNSSSIKVKGEVKSNFKLFYSIYELKDIETGQSIMVTSKGSLPKIGSKVTRHLKRIDIITINDKTFALYKETD